MLKRSGPVRTKRTLPLVRTRSSIHRWPCQSERRGKRPSRGSDRASRPPARAPTRQAPVLPPAMPSHPIDLDTLRHGARLAGFAWSDAELEEIRPQVEAALRLLRALEAIPVGDTGPTTHYRTV